jgi:hypothetical protein
MIRFRVVITAEEDRTLMIDELHFISRKQDKDITQEFIN